MDKGLHAYIIYIDKERERVCVCVCYVYMYTCWIIHWHVNCQRLQIYLKPNSLPI